MNSQLLIIKEEIFSGLEYITDNFKTQNMLN